MTTRHLDPVPPDHKETAAMNRIYTHAQAGEPNAHLNDHNPADPFVVVGFGADWDFTSKDPHWCRRVAATWTHAAELLEQAIEADAHAARTASVAGEAR